MGPDQTVEIMRRLLVEAMILGAPLLLACLRNQLAGEPGADVDGRAGADVDSGTAAGGRVRRDHGGHALDGASAGELHSAIVHGLSPVPGID